MATRFGRQIVTVMIFALVFGASSIAPGSVALAAPILDQQQPTIDTSVGASAIGGNSQQKLGQTVKAGKVGDLVQVDLPVVCNGAADLIVEIRDVAASGQPGTTVKSTTTVSGASLPTFSGSPTFRAIVLATKVSVTSGAAYSIVLRSTGTTVADNCAIFQGPVGDPYADGDLYFEALPNVPGWVCQCDFANSRRDLPFRTWVEPATGADLSIAKTLVNPTNQNVFAATEQTYQLTVANSGPSMATGVTIVDTLPANVTLVQAHPACVNAAGTLTCTLPQGFANLAAGDSFSIFIKVKFNNAGSYTNSASVSANETDPNGSNNTSSHTQQVLATADLLLEEMSATPGMASPGGTVTYTAIVKNLGPDPAVDVTLIQTIPAVTTFVSVSPSDPATCGQGTNANEYGCRFSAGIPVGATRSVDVTVTAPMTPQMLTSSATAQHNQPPLIFDPVPPQGAPNSFTGFRSWVVSESVPPQTVIAGGTATTDTEADGATPDDPVETTVKSPTGGTVSITERGLSLPSGSSTNWTFLGAEVVISAPAGTLADPLRLTFRLDKTVVDKLVAPSAPVQIFRNYTSPVPDCAMTATTPPQPVLPLTADPCVASRTTLSDGDLEIVVLTSQASVWTFAIHTPFDFGGFEPPMGAKRKAGSTLPVRFRLFDQGGELVTPAQVIDVIAPSSPSSRQVSCETGLTLSDELPITVAGDGLHFDSETNTYAINWKTEKIWAGTCRELLLALIDGSVQRTRLIFE